MPPRWPRKPDRNDPEYRRLEDRLNFAVHVGLFAAFNSGLWFFQILLSKWDHLELLTGIWLALLVAHGVIVFAIADYSPNPDYNPDAD
jgi:hypothetical protein